MELYLDFAWKIVRYHLRDADDADRRTVLHDALLRAIRYLKKKGAPDAGANYRAYLAAIVKSRCADYGRARQTGNARTVPLLEDAEDLVAPDLERSTAIKQLHAKVSERVGTRLLAEVQLAQERERGEDRDRDRSVDTRKRQKAAKKSGKRLEQEFHILLGTGTYPRKTP